jgi:myo-inositol-1(or 4)-monophosphatase
MSAVARWEAWRDVAVEAAEAASRLIRLHAGRVRVEAEKSNPKDLVTFVDKECEAVIRSVIAARMTEPFAFLGEESVAPGSEASTAATEEAVKSSSALFVVDPVDGTTNFIHGLLFSCVSVGVVHEGSVVAAAISDPYREETWHAVRSRGAFLNARRIHVSDHTRLDEALLTYNIHSLPHVRKAMFRAALAVADEARGLRSLGSAALQLAWVAGGRCDGFWELDLNAWDLAAGSLLVQEAGGRVTDTRGEDYTIRTRDVLGTCGAPGIHDRILHILRETHTDRVPPVEE